MITAEQLRGRKAVMPAKAIFPLASRRPRAKAGSASVSLIDPIPPDLKSRFFRAFWNSSKDLLLFFNRDLRLADLNQTAFKQFRKRFRANRSALVGRHITEIFPYLKGSEPYKKFRDVIRTGKPASIAGISAPDFPGICGSVFAFRVINGLGLICTDESLSERIQSELNGTIELLERLTAHDIALREEESRRLASKIHDNLSPNLSILKMELFWLSSKLECGEVNPSTALSRIAGMTSILDDSINSIRNICSELRPALLDDLGLPAAIEWQVGESQKWHPIQCRLDIDGRNLKLGPDISLCLFRVFNEGYTNILRHSRATKASILLRLIPAKHVIEMKIRDNGRGIKPEEIADPQSFGLIGMRERLWPFKGRMSILSRPNKGTTLTISIPTPPRTNPNGHP